MALSKEENEMLTRVGRGTRFKIHLPMAAPAETDVDLAV